METGNIYFRVSRVFRNFYGIHCDKGINPMVFYLTVYNERPDLLLQQTFHFLESNVGHVNP